MSNKHTDDPLFEIVATTELSLALIGLLYYYTVQLPEQRKTFKKHHSSIRHAEKP